MSDGFLKGKPKGGSSCDCHRCNAGNKNYVSYMILCDTCGNKRCPRASDHRLECTHSNYSGQKGSVYA